MIAAIGLAAALLASVVGMVGHVSAQRFQAEMDRPVIQARPGHGRSSQRHREPSAPTGAAGGDPGRARMRFVDLARQAGLDYRWTIPGPRPIDALQGIGNGCAFLDYDNSGDLSVLLVGTNHLALFKGDGHGHFTDVTHRTGLDRFHGHFLGCAVGDYDGDGYDDLYISGYRTGLLLHNEGGNGFRDVTKQAGLSPQPWGTSCAWGDIDGSGRLSLFVGNYVQFDPKKDPRLCPTPGPMSACSPKAYSALRGVLYHNEGHGRFRDVTAIWIGSHASGNVLGVAFADYNHSGRQSLYTASDQMPGNLLANVGGRFQDKGCSSGTSVDGHGDVHAGMGIDWGDYDNDGRLDLAVMAFRTEPKCVYRNIGSGIFEEISDTLALTPRTWPYVAFGVKWADFGNDGWLDLMIANGHVQDNIHDIDRSEAYRQRTQLFHNDHGRLFVDLSASAGLDLRRPIVGRGLAVGDYDNDGKVDALVVDSEGAPLLLHNDSQDTGHWLSFTLIGTRSNRDGYGASVTVTAGGLTQTRWCHADGSYLSSSDKRVHVGLGGASSADSVTVRWPDGHRDHFRNVRADRFYSLREGDRRLERMRP
ncbi:MAG: CRTAC1 family protein [Armatimonadetes bacterium]|nr:CRTAC1 family protein [Armatimonadota bacterium]